MSDSFVIGVLACVFMFIMGILFQRLLTWSAKMIKMVQRYSKLHYVDSKRKGSFEGSI